MFCARLSQRALFHPEGSPFLQNRGPYPKRFLPGPVIFYKNRLFLLVRAGGCHKKSPGELSKLALAKQPVIDLPLIHTGIPGAMVSLGGFYVSLCRKTAVRIDRCGQPVFRHRIVKFHLGQPGTGAGRPDLFPGKRALFPVMRIPGEEGQPQRIFTRKNKAAVFPQPPGQFSEKRVQIGIFKRPQKHNRIPGPLQGFPGLLLLLFLYPVLGRAHVGDVGSVPVSLPVDRQVLVPAVRHRHLGAAPGQETGEGPVIRAHLKHLLRACKLHPLQKVFPHIREGIEKFRTAVLRKDFVQSLPVRTVCLQLIQYLIADIIHPLVLFSAFTWDSIS